MDHFADFIETVTRTSLLKVDAARACNAHPDVLLISDNTEKWQKAFSAAHRTLVYYNKTFLIDTVNRELRRQFDTVESVCKQCELNKTVHPFHG